MLSTNVGNPCQKPSPNHPQFLLILGPPELEYNNHILWEVMGICQQPF